MLEVNGPNRQHDRADGREVVVRGTLRIRTCRSRLDSEDRWATFQLVDARILAREKSNPLARLCMPAFEGAGPKYHLINAQILPANQPIDSVW